MIFRRSKRKPFLSYNKRLYHGTNVRFEEPKSDRNTLPCDFGRGFYLTEIYDRAVSRAEEKATLVEGSEKWILVFEFDDERAYADAKNGKLQIKEYREDKEWLDAVTMFWDDSLRELWENAKIEGIIIAPSSDARTWEILNAYRSSLRSREDVEKALRELRLDIYGTQYFFGTDKVIMKYLKFVSAHRIE